MGIADRQPRLTGGESRADLRAYRRHVEAVDADRADALVTGPGYSADEIGALSGGLIRASDVEADVAVEGAPVFLSEDADLGDCEGGGYLVDKLTGEVVTTWCGSDGCAKHMAERSARRLAEVLLGFVYSFPGSSMRSALLTLTWPTKPERWTWTEYSRRGGVDERAVDGVPTKRCGKTKVWKPRTGTFDRRHGRGCGSKGCPQRRRYGRVRTC